MKTVVDRNGVRHVMRVVTELYKDRDGNTLLVPVEVYRPRCYRRDVWARRFEEANPLHYLDMVTAKEVTLDEGLAPTCLECAACL